MPSSMNKPAFRPEEIEPLWDYEVVQDDDDEYGLLIPGYYKGEPRVHELHYDGGEHAILVRNRRQCILCDHIHPDARKDLYEAHDVFVEEKDTKRRYMLTVVQDDIGEAAAEAARLHDYRFRYHPNPLADGTFSTGWRRCDRCGKRTAVYYYGPTGATHADWMEKNTICPACIAAGRHDVELFPELASHIRSFGEGHEVFSCSPPFLDDGKPTTHWGVHCVRLGIYLGKLEPEDLTEELERLIRESWDGKLFEVETPDAALKGFKEGRQNTWLFRCSTCGKVFATFSFREK